MSGSINYSSKGSSPDDLYVVGIGASAGGLEAIHDLFDHIPSDTNVAYVIIQHLSPDYKSLLAELLKKHTSMSVQEATDNLQLKSNSVYVIPNKHHIVLRENKLKLIEKTRDVPNTAVDIFFQSLAREKKEHAIGVILSGTGTDGTKGARDIKNAGGMVLVQDPVTAKFNGMPNSVVNSTFYDMILAPELISEEIVKFLHNKKELDFEMPENLSSEKEEKVMKILHIIKQKADCDFRYYKKPTILRRISKRMAINNKKGLDDYIDFLRDNSEEVHVLCSEFLIGVTRFFRDNIPFSIVMERVIPDVFREKPVDKTVKVWVAGCSSGEEAYSYAMLLDQYMKSNNDEREVKIFATDIDKTAIDFAARGVYPENIKEAVPADLLKKYFNKEGDKYKVRQHLRKMVIFAYHDLLKDPPFGKIDILSCRNLLIYMKPIMQKKILSLFHFSLNLNGFMVLGSSESIGEYQNSFQEINKRWKIFRNIKVERDLKDNLFGQFNPDLDVKSNKAVPAQVTEKPVSNNNLQELVNESVMEESGMTGILINDRNEVIQAFGDFNKFLKLPEKKFNLNVLKMVPQGLSTALATGIQRAGAGKAGGKNTINGVTFKSENQRRTTKLVTIPLGKAPDNGRPSVILVLLKDLQVEDEETGNGEVYNINKGQQDRIEQLENELAETRSLLQSTVEEQETSSEELQSANEELISANEELQSTNEELQSLNEELHTVNTEHQQKIKELIQLNDDLNNYFLSSSIPQIFLDKELKIRKFTPASREQINLIEGDVGRSFRDFSTNVVKENVVSMVEEVNATGKTISKEVQLNNNRFYNMTILPYIKQDNKHDGVVLTFSDVTELKRLNNMIENVINSSTNAILALKTVRGEKDDIVDFEISMANKPSRKVLRLDKDPEGNMLSDMLPALKNKKIYKFFEEVVKEGGAKRSEIYFEDIKKWYDLSIVKLDDGLALTFADISERVKAEDKLKNAFEELKTAKQKLQDLNQDLNTKVEERTKKLALSNERFHLLSLATNDVIKDWSIVDNSVWFNKNIKDQFGYNPEKLKKGIEAWYQLIHKDDREKIQKSVSDILNKSFNHWSGEYRLKKSDGTYAYILDRGYVMYNESKMPYRMISSMVDLTNLKKAQEELKLTNEKLLRINNDLDNFVYTASHDLKAPISNIEGLVNALRDIVPEDNSDGDTIVSMITDSINKFKVTIKDLSDISRIQKMQDNEEEFLVAEVLQEIKSGLSSMIRHANVNIIEDLGVEKMHFSKKNFRSIVYNLISNAIKYRSPERTPEILVKTYSGKGHTVLEIKDNGLGIDENKQKKIFTMFKRFHDHVEGSGIGMYIVKRIVDNCSGSITLQSKVNEGTTFKIEFPDNND